jgi:CD109 antigen
VPTKTVKPGASVTIKAETQPNSLVAILGGDIALTFLGIGNLISDGYLEEKLSFDIQGYNFKLGDKHGVFGKTNGFIISPTTQKKHTCTKFEKDVLKADFVGRLGSDFDVPSSDSILLEKTSVIRKNFPEIWIYDVQKTSSGEITLNEIVPDSITDFMISGFAVNKNKGFAVARRQKVSVFKDFFIKLEKPYSIQYGETVDIQVIVYNYMDSSGDATITLNNRKDQYTFVSGDTTSQSLTTFVTSQGTSSVTFTIQPKVSGKVFLNIDGKLKGAKDEIEDFILVESVGISKYITYSAVVDLSERPELPAIEWEFKIPTNIVANSVSCKAHVSTALALPDCVPLSVKSTILM